MPTPLPAVPFLREHAPAAPMLSPRSRLVSYLHRHKMVLVADFLSEIGFPHGHLLLRQVVCVKVVRLNMQGEVMRIRCARHLLFVQVQGPPKRLRITLKKPRL
jgi:hypothetical protein